MTYTITEITAARDFVAGMVADRQNGVAFLPIFQRLELELEKFSATEAAIERACRISRARSVA